MRFFFESSTINYKMRHALAVELNKLYPGSTFAAIDTSYTREATRYLKAQKEIQYEFIDDYIDLCNRSVKEETDYQQLAEFEKTAPEKSLWFFVAMDREWGHQFCKGVYLPASYIQHINSPENIWRMASGLLKYYTKILENFKPDVFIPASGQNSMSCPIIYQLCENFNVFCVIPEIVRTQNYMVLTGNRQCLFEQVDDTCRKLISGNLTMDMSEGERIYTELMADRENEKYFNVSRVDHFKFDLPWLSFFLLASKSIAGQIRRWIRSRKHRNSDTLFRQPPGIRTFFYNIYYAVLVHYRRIQLMDPGFYHSFDPTEKYIYFPLHSTNEYSTQVQGTMWIDQLQIVQALAKSIPHDWKVIVKEHPGILVWRVRPRSFYEEIKKYPNVKLVKTDLSSNRLISHAQMIFTIVGTTGWEAVLRGKPVVSMEGNMFDVLGLNRICTDLKELSRVIYEENERIKAITAQERRRRIICLLTAIAKHGIWVDDPIKFIGEKESTPEERQPMAELLARAYKDYIEFRRSNMTRNNERFEYDGAR